MMNTKQLIETLENVGCHDPYSCPFGMCRKNAKGDWVCFAEYPNGDPQEDIQGCVAYQAAEKLREFAEALGCLAVDEKARLTER